MPTDANGVRNGYEMSGDKVQLLQHLTCSDLGHPRASAKGRCKVSRKMHPRTIHTSL